MSAKFFGQWLVERNLITPDQLIAATDLQQRLNISLGQAAIRLGYLNGTQVERINLEQQRQDKRFGEIAIELQLLNEDQMTELLDLQRKHNILFGEAVARLGFLKPAHMERELEAHRRSQQDHENVIQTNLEHIKEPAIVRGFIDVTVKMFKRMIQQTVKIESVANTDVIHVDRACFMQAARGDCRFQYFITLPEPHQLAIASRILKLKLNRIDEVVHDAAREFVNIVAGSGCVKLGEQGLDLHLEPSIVLAAHSPLPAHRHAVVADMTSIDGAFQIGFLFE